MTAKQKKKKHLAAASPPLNAPLSQMQHVIPRPPLKNQIVHNDEISPCGRNDAMPLRIWREVRRRLRRRLTSLHFSCETPVIPNKVRNLICPLVIGNAVRNLICPLVIGNAVRNLLKPLQVNNFTFLNENEKKSKSIMQ